MAASARAAPTSDSFAAARGPTHSAEAPTTSSAKRQRRARAPVRAVWAPRRRARQRARFEPLRLRPQRGRARAPRRDPSNILRTLALGIARAPVRAPPSPPRNPSRCYERERTERGELRRPPLTKKPTKPRNPLTHSRRGDLFLGR